MQGAKENRENIGHREKWMFFQEEKYTFISNPVCLEISLLLSTRVIKEYINLQKEFRRLGANLKKKIKL